jgi:hypothetical protein
VIWNPCSESHASTSFRHTCRRRGWGWKVKRQAWCCKSEGVRRGRAHVQSLLDDLVALGEEALGPVVAGATDAVDEVVWLEQAAVRLAATRVEHVGLQVQQQRARYVPSMQVERELERIQSNRG